MTTTDNRISQAMDDDDFCEAARLSLRQGDDNSGYGFFVLGWIFDEGKLGLPQKQKARKYYERAIDRGNIEANRYLGLLLLELDEIESARKAFKNGENGGDIECRDLLLQTDIFEREKVANNAIENGEVKEASEQLKALAEQDSEYALLTLGFLHQDGRLGRIDYDRAKMYFKRAAKLGNGDAYYRLGCLTIESLDYAAARSFFLAGAKLGDDQCRRVLSERDLFLESKIEAAINSNDFISALRQLKKLADNGSAFALGQIGWIYHSGKIGKPDIFLAKEYYEQAIKAGSNVVYRNLGLLLREVDDLAEARRIFLRGARAGQSSCMYQLSRMLRTGAGGEVDKEQADFWLRKAAVHGHIVSKVLHS